MNADIILISEKRMIWPWILLMVIIIALVYYLQVSGRLLSEDDAIYMVKSSSSINEV